METLTTIQDAAIQYLHSRSRPNDRRCHRLAVRMVKEWCVKQGWDVESATRAGVDALQVFELERDAR